MDMLFKVKNGKRKVKFSTYSNDVLFAKAFTLSEILITLVIIGVVAAITVPMLMNDTNDKQWNVARQKARVTIGEAFKLMSVSGEIDKNKSTEEFVKEVLPKYLKIAKICGQGESAARECGFASTIKRANGTTLALSDLPMTWEDSTYTAVTNTIPTEEGVWGESANYDTKYPGHNESYFLQTLDGFSLNFFYNPYCAYDINDRYRFYRAIGKVQQSMDVICFNAVYDMNGNKGPNTIGKDIGFVGSFYNGYNTTTEAVLPQNYNDEYKVSGETSLFVEASNYCKNLDKDNNWILPNIDELSLLYINQMMLRGTKKIKRQFYSRSIAENSDYIKGILFNTGHRNFILRNDPTSSSYYVICVRKDTLK